MQLRHFEQVCGTCHLGQIVGEGRATAKGVSVFAVPGLDVETLYDRGISVGEWPEFAEETLSPFTELLLSVDPEFQSAFEAVQNLDLLDLTDANDATLEQVAGIAWSFKELMLDVSARGTDALRERLESVIGKPLDTQEAADLVAMLPVDMMLNAQRSWFPALPHEVALYSRGEVVANPSTGGDLEQMASQVAAETYWGRRRSIEEGKEQ